MSQKPKHDQSMKARVRENPISKKTNLKSEAAGGQDFEKYADDFPIHRSGLVIFGWTK